MGALFNEIVESIEEVGGVKKRVSRKMGLLKGVIEVKVGEN